MIHEIADRLSLFKNPDLAFSLFRTVLVENTQDLNYFVRARILSKCVLIHLLMKQNTMVQTAKIIRPEVFNAKKNKAIAVGMVKVTLPTGSYTVKSIAKLWSIVEANRRRAMIEYIRLDSTRVRIFATLKQGEWFIQDGQNLYSKEDYDFPSIVSMATLHSKLDQRKKDGQIKATDIMKVTSALEIQCMKLGVYD